MAMLSVACLVAACSAAPDLPTVPPAPSVPPLSAAQREVVGLLALDRVLQSAGPGTDQGGYRSDTFCAGPIGGVSAQVGDPQFAIRLHATFARVIGDHLGFRVAGDPNTLFPQASAASQAEFLLAARVEDLRYSLCRQLTLLGRQIGLTGEVTARFTWQMLDRKTGRLVYDGRTLAHGEQIEPVLTQIEGVLLDRLFEDALVRLAADNRFRRAVVSDLPSTDALRRAEAQATEWTRTGPPDGGRPWGAPLAPSGIVAPNGWAAGPSPTAAHSRPFAADASAAGLLTLTGPPFFVRPFAVNADRIRAATVTVLGMGNHGSGFFLTDDGWLLTANHVVADSDVVRVRLLDGRDLWARVVRRHPLRDVALLRVAAHGLDALPIRPTRADVSETTYAIGTPLDRALGQTVSQGIISAWRPDSKDGLDVYQATTPVHGGNSGGPLVDAWGNVVAITVSTMTSGAGASFGSSVSFFIPIHDALRHLGIEVLTGSHAASPAGLPAADTTAIVTPDAAAMPWDAGAFQGQPTVPPPPGADTLPAPSVPSQAAPLAAPAGIPLL